MKLDVLLLDHYLNWIIVYKEIQSKILKIREENTYLINRLKELQENN